MVGSNTGAAHIKEHVVFYPYTFIQSMVEKCHDKLSLDELEGHKFIKREFAIFPPLTVLDNLKYVCRGNPLTILNEHGEPENATNMRQPISADEMQNEMTNGFVISFCTSPANQSRRVALLSRSKCL